MVMQIERHGRDAIVHVEGDVVVATARGFADELRALVRRRGVGTIALDFAGAGRVDSAGVAAVSLFTRQAERAGRRVEVIGLSSQHRAVFALDQETVAATDVPPPSVLERVGGRVIDAGQGARALARLVADAARASARAVTQLRRAPSGAIVDQLDVMGTGAMPIVGLLSFLLGMTMAFQGLVQLRRFGASPFVADMVSVSMVRELAPLMTAVILAGRTGAANAAELATMHMRSEIDALSTMGIAPVRFLIVPRLAAITVAGPALTLYAMFVGVVGGMVVAAGTMSLPIVSFWQRVVERVDLGDVAHGLGKSLAFAWIIGLVGSHTGMRAGRDASSVGSAATRTVVTSVSLIVLVDAVVATVTAIVRGP